MEGIDPITASSYILCKPAKIIVGCVLRKWGEGC